MTAFRELKHRLLLPFRKNELGPLMRFSVTPDGKIYGECSCLTLPRNSFVDCRKIKEKPTEMNPFEN